MSKYKIDLNSVKFNIIGTYNFKYRISAEHPSLHPDMIKFHNDVVNYNGHSRILYYKSWNWKKKWTKEVKNE